MTRKVITVNEDTSFKEVARTIRSARISAVPVLDREGRIVGIVSEADLLRKEEDRAPRSLWSRLFRRDGKARATTAKALMTRNVIGVAPGASIAEAARLLHRVNVRRLPVVEDDGTLVGIVSRRDLLRVFLRSDAEIRREIVDGVIREKLWLTPGEAHVNVAVRDGVVVLEGTMSRRSICDILVEMTSGVEGVVAVRNRIGVEHDDTKTATFHGPWSSIGAPPIGR